jgi:hypothetical protein
MGKTSGIRDGGGFPSWTRFELSQLTRHRLFSRASSRFSSSDLLGQLHVLLDPRGPAAVQLPLTD